MEIIYHGSWSAYEPDELPPSAPLGTIFAKRDGDDKDWYEFVRDNDIQDDSVVFTCMHQCGVWRVGSAVRDISRLHPANQTLFEIVGFRGKEKELNGKIFDPDTKEFHDFSIDRLKLDFLLA